MSARPLAEEAARRLDFRLRHWLSSFFMSS